MGKYRSNVKGQSAPSRNVVNPYMRGIGCLLMLIVPVFSYLAGYELAKQRFGSQVLPAAWYGYMSFPPEVYNLRGLGVIAQYLSRIEFLPATLTLAVIVAVAVGGILAIVFGYMYSIFAPSKHGPFDVPAPRVKTKKYKR